MNIIKFSAFLLGSLANVSMAQSHDHGALAAHVHGSADLELTRDGNELVVNLRAPMGDVVGFERAPASTQEQALVDKAQAFLSKPAVWLGLPTTAGCQQKSVRFATSAQSNKVHDQDHDHDHDHEHDAHAEISLLAVLNCAQPQRLTFNLSAYFQQFPDSAQMVVQYLLPEAGSVELSASNPAFAPP